MRTYWKHALFVIAGLATIAGLAFGNSYYTHGGYPATGSVASSAGLRAELDSITTGFDKLPSFTGNASKPVIVNAGETALGVAGGALSLGGNLTISGAFTTTGSFNTTLAQGATTTLTLPLVNGTLATLAGTETLTNKTITTPLGIVKGDVGLGNVDNTSDATKNAASVTLTNKTITAPAISAPTFSGAASGSLSGLALTSAVLTTSTVAADPTTALGIASKQYVDTTMASYTGTDTLAAGVGLARLSGVGFTLTLPPVASNQNREVTILHFGDNFVQYNIKGNAAENIIAPDGSGNTYVLNTFGESLRLKCDISGWYVLQHLAETPWVDAGPMTITGTTSNPTKATTPDYDHVWWKRHGKEVSVKWVLQYSSSAGAADGSGAYVFAMPTGIALDSSITPVNTAWATATMSEGIRSGVFSHGKVVVDSVQQDNVIAFAYGQTSLQWARDSATTPLGSGAYPMTTNEMGYYLEARFPAFGFR